MSGYFSITFSFKQSRITDGFISDLYQKVTEVFPFESGYFDNEQLSYEAIVLWNQEQLACEDEPDFKQVLFQSNHYTQLRGILYHSEEGVEFELIVPRDDVIQLNKRLYFTDSQLEPLHKLAISLWNEVLVDAVQTHDDSSEAYSIKEIEAGLFLTYQPFAIIDQTFVESFPEGFIDQENIIELENNGAFIIKP